MPTIRRPKLKKGDISLLEIYRLSKLWWYKTVDDKESRAKLDVTSGKLVQRINFEYDQSIKQWVQTGIRHIKFTFIMASQPISYKKIDTKTIHRYPCTFVFYNLDLGWNSPIRFRTGSFKRILSPRKGSSKQERIEIANKNIKNGVNPLFVYQQMWVLNYWGLLYGPLTCFNKAPHKTNPSMIPFCNKQEVWLINKIFRHLLSPRGISMVKGKVFK